MKMNTRVTLIVGLCCAVSLCDCCGCSNEADSALIANPQITVKDIANTADKSLVDEVNKANTSGRYAFVLFYSDDNDAVAHLRQTVASVKDKLESKAHFLEAKTNFPAANPYVTKYNLDRMPMPLLIAFAENGAAVAALQQGCGTRDIENAFVSPKTADAFKAVQEGKIIALLVGNENIEGFSNTLLSAQKLARVWNDTRLIVVDPADPKEQRFLEESGVSGVIKQAVLQVIRGGRSSARLVGEATEEQITDALNSARRQAPGCG
jgi:phosphotransferase system IIB component